MARGRPRKVKKVVEPVVEVKNVEDKSGCVVTISEPVEFSEPTATMLEPLAPDQAYFESPTGNVIIGDANKDHIWDRTLNDGKGGWINKRR